MLLEPEFSKRRSTVPGSVLQMREIFKDFFRFAGNFEFDYAIASPYRHGDPIALPSRFIDYDLWD
jgi:hypothetical protein